MNLEKDLSQVKELLQHLELTMFKLKKINDGISHSFRQIDITVLSTKSDYVSQSEKSNRLRALVYVDSIISELTLLSNILDEISTLDMDISGKCSSLKKAFQEIGKVIN